MTDEISVAEYRKAQADAMKERGRDGLQQRVMDRLEQYGWRAYHTFDSRKSSPGFPDIIALNELDEGRYCSQIVIELKREGEWPTPEQEAWLDAFSKIDRFLVETYLWFPSDLLDGTIDCILSGGYRERALWTTRRDEVYRATQEQEHDGE